MHVSKSITVNRPPEEVYQFWHEFPNLPRFMSHLESVEATGDRRSHWRAKAPAGMTVEWDAEIVADQPDRLIAWRSIEGSDINHSGVVYFEPAPGGRGTEVRIEVDYEMPGGMLGQFAARLLGEEPEQQVYDDLRAFKQVMETGEVVRSDATTAEGRMRKHPGQPPEVSEVESLPKA